MQREALLKAEWALSVVVVVQQRLRVAMRQAARGKQPQTWNCRAMEVPWTRLP